MKAADWRMFAYIGIGLGFLFLAIGGWIWLNVEGFMGWTAIWQYFEYRGYTLPLIIGGVVLLVVGLAFSWRAGEETRISAKVS